MGTFIRLGSTMEGNFKEYYMNKKGYKNNLDLHADSNWNQGVFQRTLENKKGSVIHLYKQELNIDLTNSRYFIHVQEAMLHRHLFAHNSGIIDNKYITQLKDLAGEDLSLLPEMISDYPMEDMYWFKPLEKFNDFITYTRKFFAEL